MINVDNFIFKIELFNKHQSLMSSLLMNFMYTFSTFLFYWNLFIKLLYFLFSWSRFWHIIFKLELILRAYFYFPWIQFRLDWFIYTFEPFLMYLYRPIREKR